MKNKKLGRNALISVYRKSNVVAKLGKKIHDLGFRIYSSGGTAQFLRKNKVKVVDVIGLTGFPPILDHRVVTLHPKIHAGILAKEVKDHENQLRERKIPKFDLLIVDLYPVWEGIKSGSLNETLDLIDIGGPAMLRAAAKNFNNGRIVVCDLNDTDEIIDQLEKNNEVDFETRKRLAGKVFGLMKEYDGVISDFLGSGENRKLKYGENPHQEGWFSAGVSSSDALSLQKFAKLSGKELSFNNYLDIDAAIEALAQVGGNKPACVITKHTNPVGFSVKDTMEGAYHSAWYDGDPLAAFGGIVGLNRVVGQKLAKDMVVGKGGEKKFFEVLLAPLIDKTAIEILAARKNLRILVNPSLKNPKLSEEPDSKKIRGGVLYQNKDNFEIKEKHLKIATKKKPSKSQIKDLLFAWKVVKVCKSNAVCIVKNQTLISAGVGQQDRLESCKIAIAKAVDSSRGKSKSTPIGAVAASDAFFPFPDGPETLIKAGVKAIIQPGGSIRDQESIDLCNRHKIAMVFTSTRSFKH